MVVAGVVVHKKKDNNNNNNAKVLSVQLGKTLSFVKFVVKTKSCSIIIFR